MGAEPHVIVVRVPDAVVPQREAELGRGLEPPECVECEKLVA